MALNNNFAAVIYHKTKGNFMEIKEIIERIGIIRGRKGINAKELSDMVGKHGSYISRLEAKKDFNPSVKTLKEIIEGCGCTFEEFFYHDINQYQIDKELIEKLKKASPEKKELALKILEM